MMMEELQAVSLCQAAPHHCHMRHTGGFLLILALSIHRDPVLEAENSHLAPETGASGRRAAARTRWGGPREAASCLGLEEAIRDHERSVVRERACREPSVLPLVFSFA